MEREEMIGLCKEHTLYTWSAMKDVNPLPIERAEGVYVYEVGGKRHYDFNSQLMSVNIGHGHPKVIAAMKDQLDKLVYAFPGSATEPRARLGKKLANHLPDPLNTVFFTLGGADANEHGIRMAKAYTGRSKIISRYRSYHGGTSGAIQMTGDPRRLPNEGGSSGFVKVLDPWPYRYEFGETEAEITEQSLRYLGEVIQMEGPETIAAMVVETVTGTNGVLPPPAGYLKGLKKLLEPHGILLLCDEVMAGFGRTGKMFAFEHFGIVPDIVTCAKGLTSSYIPLGAVAVSDSIAAHFHENVYFGGLTYNSHPLALRTAEAVIDVLVEEELIENAERMGHVMAAHMAEMKRKHPCVKATRNLGLFGMMDLQKDRNGTPLAPYNGKSEAMQELGEYFRSAGLFTFIRWGSFMCNPPLCITEEELAACFSIIDGGLALMDAHFHSEP